MASGTISIIIVNFNTFELTCACIQSIIDKTLDVAYEIILVDNHSTDVDPQEFQKHFPAIVLIENDTNVGFAKGNNIGIARATGDYILLLNSDTVLKNNAVFICRKFLDENPGTGVVSARLENPDGTVQNNCQRFPSVGPRVFELLRLQKFLPHSFSGKILLGAFFSHDEVAYPDWVWGTFFMFEKRALQKLKHGKLADDFFMYVEDMEWCMQFRNSGFRIAFNPEARVIHYMGKSGGQRNEHIENNMRIFYAKYYSKFRIWLIRMLDKLLGL
jgi:GT2 family glycosyltransferase